MAQCHELNSAVPPSQSGGDQLSILWVLVAYKSIFFTLVVGAILLVPAFNWEKYYASPPWPHGKEEAIARYFISQDAVNYLRLSLYGYQKDSHECAFYPLWPFLIRVAAQTTALDNLIVAMGLAQVFSIAGLYVFWRYVVQLKGRPAATYALALLLAFPGAIFFNFPYTESLFLLLAVSLFMAMHKKEYIIASACAFFLPITRPIGILCLAPVVWEGLACAWNQMKQVKGPSGIKPSLPSRMYELFRTDALKRYGSVAASCFLGYACYFAYMYSATGNPFEGFAAQRHFENEPSIRNIFNLAGFFKAAVNIGSLHGHTNSALDRLMFLIFICSLPLVYKQNKTLFIYTLVVGLLPAMATWFISYTRFIILCFPIYIAWGDYAAKAKCSFMFWYCTALLAAIQVCLLLRHLNHYWSA